MYTQEQESKVFRVMSSYDIINTKYSITYTVKKKKPNKQIHKTYLDSPCYAIYC